MLTINIVSILMILVFWVLWKTGVAYFSGVFYPINSDEQLLPKLSEIMISNKNYYGRLLPRVGWRDAVYFAIAGVLFAVGDAASGLDGNKMLFNFFLFSQLSLGAICYESDVIPSLITYPLGALGLFLGAKSVFIGADASIYGVIFGAGIPLAFGMWWQLTRGRTGLGGGVFAQAGAVGAWVGPYPSLWILCLSAIYGAFFIPIYRRVIGRDLKLPYTFGPIYSAFAIIVFSVPHLKALTPIYKFFVG